MAAWLDLVGSRPGRLWLNDTAYAERVLAAERAPWQDVAKCLAWRHKAMALLASDVAVLDVAAALGAWAGSPLTALREASCRNVLHDLAQGLTRVARKPVGVVVPSARVLAGSGATPEEIEDATDELADFLRALGKLPIAALALQSAATPGAAAQGGAAGDAAAESESGTLANLAAHYGWDLGYLEVDAMAFVDPNGTRVMGHVLSAEFWRGGAPPPLGPAGFYYGAIPRNADAKLVLERLQSLR